MDANNEMIAQLCIHRSFKVYVSSPCFPGYLGQFVAKTVRSFLAERYYTTFGLWHEPSVCRLSVCRRWRCCTLETLTLRHFLRCLISRGLGQFVLKFWAKIWRDSMESCKLNTTGVWKIGLIQPISRFISKTVKDTDIVTMEDE